MAGSWREHWPETRLAGRIAARDFLGAADLPRIKTLLVACGEGARLAHGGLGSLWALRRARATDAIRLWVDEAGEALACAFISNYLRFFLHPHAMGSEVERDLFAWAATCRRRRGEAQGEPAPRLSVAVRDDDRARAVTLARHGFVRQDDRHAVVMCRTLGDDRPLPRPELPEGFTLRPIAGEPELDAFLALFRAAFGGGPTRESRLASWRAPDYLPELVAVAPDGGLAAFCWALVDDEENALYGRRDGWVVQLGTARPFRRHGLGRATLRAGLRLLRDRGAEAAWLVVGSGNVGAQALHTADGFAPAGRRYDFHRRL